MFKLYRLDIDTSMENIVIINKRDAEKLQVHPGERVEVYPSNAPNRSIVAVVDVLGKNSRDIEGDVELDVGSIGLSDHAFVQLHLNEGEMVDICPMPRPESFEYCIAKFEKKEKFNEEKLVAVVRDIVNNKYSQALITYFLVSCASVGLDDDETVALTKAMVGVGDVLKFDAPIVADKHCIGGIPGIRTTPIVVAIVASSGIPVPNTFTRSITSAAGTADTLETYMKVDLSLMQMEKMVKKVGAALVWGGSIALSPSDDIFIRVEHPLNIDSESQIVASILSKKIAAGLTHCLLDMPVGPKAKVKTTEHGERLKKRFETIAERCGLHLKVVLSDGTQPVGNGVGPVLEMMDVLKVLKNDIDAPLDLKEKSVELAGELFEYIGKAQPGEGKKLALQILESGQAYAKFEEIRKFQGENELPALSELFYDVKVEKAGKITAIDNKIIVKVCKLAGAPMDALAGVFLNYHVGGDLQEGDVLYRIYSSTQTRLDFASEFVKKDGHGYEIS